MTVASSHAPTQGELAGSVRAARRRRLWPLFVVLILLGVAVPLARQALEPTATLPPPAPEQPPPLVIGLGRLEPASAIVLLGAPGDAQAARVTTLLVEEGDRVQTGQIVAVLDSAEKARAQLDSARAQLAFKRAALARQREETEYQTQSRREAVLKAEADLAAAEAEYTRQETLRGQNVATAATLEKRKAEFLTAQSSAREAKAALRRIEAEGPDGQIDIAVAAAEVAAAEADAKVAEAALRNTEIRAPFAGTVLSVKARPGERLDAGGLVEIAGVQDMHAIVEVYQSDIGRVRLGQLVELRAEAIRGVLTGEVTRLGQAVKRQTVVNNDPASSTDARVVEVTVSLGAEDSVRVAALSRLQIRATFLK